MDRESAFRQIIDDAFDSAVEKTVMQVVANKIGSGLDGDIKDAVIAEAHRIIKEDEQIRDSIRKRLIHWIGKQ
jgi:hypothetical protein